jgi:REP element-mobilizing transposase RayT
LKDDSFKDIITESLTYLAESNRVYVYAFVIMGNHFHLMWQMMGAHKKTHVQRDFLKYTSQQILKAMKTEKSKRPNELLVNAKDRKYQVRERNSLGVPLWKPEVFEQKLDYIHNNPVKAGFWHYPEDYKYSSARFYEKNENDWVFLTHHEGRENHACWCGRPLCLRATPTRARGCHFKTRQ